MNRLKDQRQESTADAVGDNIERSLIIIKPDGVRKKVVGKIISRFEKENLVIERLKMIKSFLIY